MMMSTRRFELFDCVLTLVVFAELVAALQIIPPLVPTNSTEIISAAVAVGYNTEAAFWTVLAWAVLAVGTSSLAQRWRTRNIVDIPQPMEAGSPSSEKKSIRGSLKWRELLGVFLLFALAYCPLFLARHGPYMEDVIFLAALQRMDCGQLPYTDFAFLYGPLMIYPLWTWSQVFGASMASYFSFLAILEGVQFAVLMGVLQYFVPNRRQRYWIFLLLFPFLFNTLLGLNYNGMRRLMPAFIVVLLAYQPLNLRANAVGALLLGLCLAYSHEYGLAALFAVLGMYGVMFLRGEMAASLKMATLIAVGSLSVWVAVTVVVLGSSMTSYVELVRNVMGMMSSGHAAFRFYWTMNSLALFGLLAIACVAIGKGLLPRLNGVVTSGDRLLVGATLFAIVMLKSGLTRSDLWHLSGGFMALLFAFLLPLQRSAMAVGRTQSRVASVLIVIASVTYLVGIAPTGSLYASSYVKGFVDVLSTRRSGIEAATRGTSLEFERTNPRAQFVSMGSYLAQPERADRPVLFYGRAWPVPLQVGVCAEDYKLDDLMYSEFRRPESQFLRAHPNALVVIGSDDYERLYRLRASAESFTPIEITPTKQLGRWLSTVHYDASAIEGRLQDEARERLTGNYIRTAYNFATRFGDYVVLEPR